MSIDVVHEGLKVKWRRGEEVNCHNHILLIIRSEILKLVVYEVLYPSVAKKASRAIFFDTQNLNQYDTTCTYYRYCVKATQYR